MLVSLAETCGAARKDVRVHFGPAPVRHASDVERLVSRFDLRGERRPIPRKGSASRREFIARKTVRLRFDIPKAVQSRRGVKKTGRIA